MDLYGQKSKSIPQKIIIFILEIFFIRLSWWVLFQQGGNLIAHQLGITNYRLATDRRRILFIFSIIVFFRIGIMMLFFLKRKIPWAESVSVPIAFALYYLGFSLLVLPVNQSIGFVDYLGIFIFIAGSFINTYSEFLRNNWKKNPANKGKLYIKGFFKYSMHINYFGDLLWVSGYAILTGNWYSVFIPIFLFCFFIFYNIPKLDQYLQSKYGGDFVKYKSHIKKLIPLIY